MLTQSVLNGLLSTVADVFHDWGANTEWAIIPPAFFDAECGDLITMNQWYNTSPENWSTAIVTYQVKTNGSGGVDIGQYRPIERYYFNAPLFSGHEEYKDIWNNALIALCGNEDYYPSGYFFPLQEPYSDLPITFYRGSSSQLCVYPVGSISAVSNCFKFAYTPKYGNILEQNQIRFGANCSIISSDTQYSITNPSTHLTSGITTFNALKNTPILYNDSNSTNNLTTQINNNWDITYNDTTNYITESGDTLTINVSDNVIHIGGVGGAGGLGIGGLFPIGVSGTLAFDDIIGALNLSIDNYNDEFGTDLYVPSYEELINYDDQGDFHITPLEQIPTLPTAPSFDSALDLSTYPDLLGNMVKSYYDIYGALGMSSLLVGVVLFVFLIRKLRGD